MIFIFIILSFIIVDAKIIGDSSVLPMTIDEIVPLLASFCFFSLLASTLQTAYKFYKEKTVGNMSINPFVCLYMNSILWTSYGILKGLKPVYIPNGISIPVAIICLSTYYRYSVRNLSKYFILLGLLSILTYYLYINNRVDILGKLSCIISILLSASPLSVVRTVIKEKSTASLPFFTSLFIWFASALWTFYGVFIVHDPILIIPNALSLFLATLQLSLFVIYGIQTKEYSKGSN